MNQQLIKKIELGEEIDFFKEFYNVDITVDEDRIHLAKEDYSVFCLIYLPHYFYLEPAPYHFKLIEALVDEESDAVSIIGHRESGKSVHASMAYPLWEAIREEHNFIILLGDRGVQSSINIKNIKTEFETNDLLRKDFPLLRPEDKKKTWQQSRLELSNDTMIMGLSRGQRIRGLRYKQYRPSLLVADDLEDTDMVRFKHNRDKTERWLLSEVIPAMDANKAKFLLLGNMLHNDGIMARIKKNKRFKTFEFPLVVDGDGTEWERCIWKAKFPTPESLEKRKQMIVSQNGNTYWQREYLLKVVPEEDQIIKYEDIVYYPNERLHSEVSGVGIKPLRTGSGVDLAISEKTTADFTSMVSGHLAEETSVNKIFVLPHPVNKRMGFDVTIDTALDLDKMLPQGNKFYVEKVGYQEVAIQQMTKAGLSVEAVSPIRDKRARLQSVSNYIKRGLVKFPEEGCEELIEQIVNFGMEAHDDLLDAFVYLVLCMFKENAGASRRYSVNPKRL